MWNSPALKQLKTELLKVVEGQTNKLGKPAIMSRMFLLCKIYVYDYEGIILNWETYAILSD